MIEGLTDGLHRRRDARGRAIIIKCRHAAPEGFFAAESRGLAALGATATLPVPAVHACEKHAIVLEDLGSGRPAGKDWERAGQQLAAMHSAHAGQFGWLHPGWCGDSPQDNSPQADGHRFFAERRLLPQARRAHDAALLSIADTTRLEQICLRLERLLPPAPPVLVHGDLWTGNLHACASGELALIDGGAVHNGWAETDLAMLTLFGEPPERFFASYQSAAGVGADWRERAPLLNLYHLLNHLNLFGAGYQAAVRSVLLRLG